jgi:hypothetical protein
MLRTTTYDKMEARLRMLAEGRLRSHAFLLGPTAVGKSESGRRCWPQTEEERNRYEDIVDRIRPLEARIKVNLARLERLRATAKSKGESEASKEYEVRVKGLSRANKMLENRIDKLNADLPPKGQRWIWTQGHQTARGLLDFLQKFADWDRIIFNDAEITPEMAFLLIQLLEKTGSRTIDWKIVGSKRVRFVIEADIVVIANSVTLGTRQKAIFDSVISRVLAIQFTPTVEQMIAYLKTWMQNPFVAAQVERDHADGKVAGLDLRLINRAAEMEDAGDREGCLEYLSQGYLPRNIDEIGDDERAILAYYQHHCNGQTINIAEMSRQTERFRGQLGLKRREAAVRKLMDKGVLIHLAPDTGRGRPTWNVFLVNMDEASRLLGQPVDRTDQSDQVPKHEVPAEGPSDRRGFNSVSSDSRASRTAGDDGPAGMPGPPGQTFAVFSKNHQVDPLAILQADDKEAAEKYRREHYYRIPSWIVPWEGDLPVTTNPHLRKLLIRDIRRKSRGAD